MFNRKELKDRAKLVMLRSYSKMFIACLITYFFAGGGIGISTGRLKNINFSQMPSYKLVAVYMIISIMVLIAVAVSIFALEPLNVGLKKFMLENSKTNSEINLLLFPFQKDYKNIVIVTFMRNLFIVLWSILGVVPTIVLGLGFNLFDKLEKIVEGVLDNSIASSMELMGITFVWAIFTLIFSIPAIIKKLQYQMVPYLIADNPNIHWKTALNESKEMMVGNKWPYVKLGLSFTLWILAANLCCVGVFLVIPYIEATFAELYIELSGQNSTYTGFGEN